MRIDYQIQIKNKMSGGFTTLIKRASFGLLFAFAVSRLPQGWPRTIPWIAMFGYWLFRERVQQLMQHFQISVAKVSNDKTPALRILRVDGPPGSGVTRALNENAIQKLRDTLSCDVELVPEVIDACALKTFNDPAYVKTPEYSYLFELYTAASREKDEARARLDTSKLYVFDTSLIRCHVFHIVQYTLGLLSEKHIDMLLEKNYLRMACTPPKSSTVPTIGIIYSGTKYEVCAKRVIERDGPDKQIDPKYHKLAVFTFAYVMLQISEQFLDVGFLNTAFINITLPQRVPTVEDFRNGRKYMEIDAKSNLCIDLDDDEKVRFCKAAGRWIPQGFSWKRGSDTKWHATIN